jgi:predicted nucleic acid-binding protein
VTTEPVVFELLRGARDDANYQRLAAELDALPMLPVTQERWREAAELGYRLMRRHGMRFPANDLLIACVAMAHGATLVHRDRDFDLIARHAPLTVESHVEL